MSASTLWRRAALGLASVMLAITVALAGATPAFAGGSVDVATMKPGWNQVDGYWYYVKNGELAKSWQKFGSTWYYFRQTDGTMVDDGWFMVDGEYYYFSTSGAMQTGWLKLKNGSGSYYWTYLDPSGAEHKGWLKYGGKWYYIDEEMACNDIWNIDGKFYAFDASGHVITGWFKYTESNGDVYWYYFTPSGAAASGWYKVGGTWYYFMPNEYDAMAFGGRVEINGTYYQFADSGAMLTGWQKATRYYDSTASTVVEYPTARWFYYNSNGTSVDGWVKSGNKWYYINGNDGMVANEWRMIKGEIYYFSGSGAMVTGWIQDSGEWYYFNASGTMLENGWLKSGGKWYYFLGGTMLHDVTQQIDGAWYKFDSDGAWYI